MVHKFCILKLILHDDWCFHLCILIILLKQMTIVIDNILLVAILYNILLDYILQGISKLNSFDWDGYGK